jgi:hypothetical protein
MISDTTLPHGKDWGLFFSDWREGAVFSPRISGGNRSPEPVEGNAEGAKLPWRYVVKKRPAREPRNGRKGVSPFRAVASTCTHF